MVYKQSNKQNNRALDDIHIDSLIGINIVLNNIIHVYKKACLAETSTLWHWVEENLFTVVEIKLIKTIYM